jgi:ubiquinol-cytochrome c reductase cytochrome c subunit
MISSTAARAGDRFRRHSGLIVLALALGLLGAMYSAFAPLSHADDTKTAAASADDIREGQKLFEGSCISCHGRNAQGVQDRGPSLIGVGAASVEFQVGTGRMPMARNEAQAMRKPPLFDEQQTRQLALYVDSLGGGPKIPNGELRSTDKDVIAEGGRLFRLNCASCHAFGAGGGALSSGKYAPSLAPTTDRELYAAMLTGPQNMPVFGDNQLTPDEKKAIISYVQGLKGDQDPGGSGIGRTGPVPEGLVVFLVGLVGCLIATLWIAGKS